MRFLALFSVALGVLFLGVTESRSATASPSSDPLATLRPNHPRLLFTDADLAAAMAAAKTDSLRAVLHAHIIEVARNQLTEPPIEYKLIGPRLLDQSRKAISHILTTAMAFRLTGEARYADFAKREMLTAAGFKDWNPSHFLDVAEMSCALAIGYDWLYPQLSATERTTIKTALVEKSLSFAASAYTPGSSPDKRLWFVTARHNWNQVCNGGLLAAALAIADEEPALARSVIAGVRASLPLAMEAYQPDGAYPEGPSYWDYGTTYNVLAIALCEGVLGTDFGLSSGLGFNRTALYRLYVQSPSGLSFNYADGGARLGPSAEYSWLAQRFNHPAALLQNRGQLDAEFAKHFNRTSDRFLALNAVWFPNAPADADTVLDKTPLTARFRGPAEIATLRSAWKDPLALFVGLKGGSNAVNHAHLDLGSFVADADGVRWATDMGPDDYNLPDYFGSKRWTYFRLNNRSHNVISPGNALQNPKGTAEIVALRSTTAQTSAIVDYTKAYDGAAQQLLRGVALLDGKRILIQDEIKGLKPGTALNWRMFTEANFTFSGPRHLSLEQNGHKLVMDILEPASLKFAVRSARPANSAENHNDKIVEIDVDYAGAPADARIAILLTPYGAHWPDNHVPPVLKPLAEW